ncbi:hypothetical protein FOZ60_012769, partial [Perkinsus olseni]
VAARQVAFCNIKDLGRDDAGVRHFSDDFDWRLHTSLVVLDTLFSVDDIRDGQDLDEIVSAVRERVLDGHPLGRNEFKTRDLLPYRRIWASLDVSDGVLARHYRADALDEPDQLPDGLLQRVNREVPDLPPVPAFNPEAPPPDVLHPRRVPPPSTMADEDEFLYGAPAIPPAPAENVRPSPPVSVPPAVSPRRRRVLRPGPVARPPPTPLAPTPPVRESPGLADFATPTASPVAEDPAATDSPPRPAPSRPSLATPPDQPASPVLSPLPSRPSDEPTPVRSRSSSHLLVTPDEYSSPSAPSRDTLRLVDEPPSGRSRSPSSLSPRPAQPSMASSSPSRPSPSSDEPTPVRSRSSTPVAPRETPEESTPPLPMVDSPATERDFESPQGTATPSSDPDSVQQPLAETSPLRTDVDPEPTRPFTRSRAGRQPRPPVRFDPDTYVPVALRSEQGHVRSDSS